MMRGIEAAATANFVVHATAPSAGILGATIRSGRELTIVDSGLDADTFNIVCGARLEPEAVAAALRSVVDHFASVGRPFAWWVAPGDEPDDLGRRLENGGLACEEFELAMAVAVERAEALARPVAGL